MIKELLGLSGIFSGLLGLFTEILAYFYGIIRVTGLFTGLFKRFDVIGVIRMIRLFYRVYERTIPSSLLIWKKMSL